MPKLTENDFFLIDTVSGWTGDNGYVVPSQEQLENLANDVPVPAEKLGEFSDAMRQLHHWFCSKAVVGDSTDHQKAAGVFRTKLNKVKKLVADLLDKVKTLDMVQFAAANALATNHRSSEPEITTMCQRTFSDLNRFASLCDEVEIEVKPGRDTTLLRYTITRLAAEYERFTGREAGFSTNDAGSMSTPFRRLVTGFFTLLPKEVRDGEGIDSDLMNKAISNVLKHVRADV